MFRGKTTIVLGAGASQEFKLPLGSELTSEIETLTTRRPNQYRQLDFEDNKFAYALKLHAKHATGSENLHRLIPACNEIAAGMREAASIDEFIHSRRGDQSIETCGELAIGRSILQAEDKSDLQYDTSNIYNTVDFKKISSTWIAKLRRFALEGCTKEELPDRLSQLTFINFNYDRCIEHYFFHSFRNYYQISNEESAALVSLLTIIHPYGTVAKLQWQDQTSFVSYGDTEKYQLIPELAKKIRTFTEQQEDEPLRRSIGDAIIESRLVLFLGFAYHDQNLNTLCRDIGDATVRIRGTAHGFSNADKMAIVKDLASRFGKTEQEVAIDNDVTCSEFFDKHWRSLRTA